MFAITMLETRRDGNLHKPGFRSRSAATKTTKTEAKNCWERLPVEIMRLWSSLDAIVNHLIASVEKEKKVLH
jgi:hypothetical protein